MSKTRATAAFTLAALLVLAACEGAGEDDDADTVQQDTGMQVQTAPPPMGALDPTPPDTNPSPTTPSATGADSGARQP